MQPVKISDLLDHPQIILPIPPVSALQHRPEGIREGEIKMFFEFARCH